MPLKLNLVTSEVSRLSLEVNLDAYHLGPRFVPLMPFEFIERTFNGTKLRGALMVTRKTKLLRSRRRLVGPRCSSGDGRDTRGSRPR
jgi:hypothetical protein